MFARLLTALGLISALACAALGAPGHQGSSFSPIIFGGIRPVYSENFLTENPLASPSANFTNNVSFSRGTLASVVGPDGLVTYGGNNFNNFSTDVSAGGYSGANASATPSVVTYTGTTGGYWNRTAITVPANTNIILSAVLSSTNKVNISLRDGDTGSHTVVALTTTPTSILMFYSTLAPIRRLLLISTIASLLVQTALLAASRSDRSRFPPSPTKPPPVRQDQVVTGATAYYGPAFDNVFGVPNSPLGLAIWEARTNVALWNRDLTNAAWTASARRSRPPRIRSALTGWPTRPARSRAARSRRRTPSCKR